MIAVPVHDGSSICYDRLRCPLAENCKSIQFFFSQRNRDGTCPLLEVPLLLETDASAPTFPADDEDDGEKNSGTGAGNDGCNGDITRSSIIALLRGGGWAGEDGSCGD